MKLLFHFNVGVNIILALAVLFVSKNLDILRNNMTRATLEHPLFWLFSTYLILMVSMMFLLGLDDTNIETDQPFLRDFHNCSGSFMCCVGSVVPMRIIRATRTTCFAKSSKLNMKALKLMLTLIGIWVFLLLISIAMANLWSHTIETLRTLWFVASTTIRLIELVALLWVSCKKNKFSFQFF